MDVPPPSPSKPEAAKKPEPKAADTAAATPSSAPPDKDTSPAGPTPDLPASDGSWEIVKLGHDYVTADSIQRFYRFSSLKVDGNHVWLRSPTIIMKATIGSQELLINNIKFILSYPTASKGDKALFSRVNLCKLIDPVLRPSHIDTSEIFDTVVIDAGHGGHDSGARGVYGYEKDFALKMAYSVRDALTKRGFKTVMTRDTDSFISLSGRFAVANATRAAFSSACISIPAGRRPAALRPLPCRRRARPTPRSAAARISAPPTTAPATSATPKTSPSRRPCTPWSCTASSWWTAASSARAGQCSLGARTLAFCLKAAS